MSGIEVGTAYVRVRPQMSTFRSEAQAGVRSSFSAIGKILLPTLAFAGVTEGIRKSVAAAELKQVITGQLQNAFRTAGLAYRDYAAVVDTIIKRQEELGFSFDESAQALGRSIRATKSVTAAQRIQGAAADLARGQNIGLLQATQILIRAFNGQSTGLKRLGITVDKHAKGLAVVDAVQRRFAGSSAKYAGTAAGAQARLSAAIEETEALIGSGLTPTVARLNTRLADWLNNSENQKKIQEDVNKVVHLGGVIVHDLSVAFDAVKGPLKTVVGLLGGFESIVEKALVIGLAVKARKALGGLTALTAASQKMGATVASEAGVASDALAKTAVSGQRSASLLDRALVSVGAKLAGLAVTSGETATKIVADARAETLALSGVGAVGRKRPAAAGAGGLGARGASGAVALEAAALEQTLEGLSQATESFVESSTTETVQFVKKGIDSLGTVQKTAAAGMTKAAKETGLAFQATSTSGQVAAKELATAATATSGALREIGVTVTGMTPVVVTGFAEQTLAVERLGNAGTVAEGKLAAMQGVLGRTLFRAGGGVTGEGGAIEKTLLTGAGLRGIATRVAALATRATSLGLGAYIANSLIEGFTGFSPLGALKNAIFQPSAGTEFTKSAKDLEAARASIPDLRLAKDQAEAAVQTAKAALANTRAAKTTLAYRTAVDRLAVAERDLKQTTKALTEGQQGETRASEANVKALHRLTRAAVDAIPFKLAAGFRAASDQAHYSIGVYNSLGGVLYATGKAGKSAANDGILFARSIEQQASRLKDLSPLQEHNLDLLAQMARRIKDVPPDSVIRIILDNKDALIGLDALLGKIVAVQQAAAGIDVAPRRPPDRGPLARRVFGPGKIAALDTARLRAELTKNQSSIKAAAQAELDAINAAIASLTNRLKTTHSRKKAKELNDQLQSLLGNAASIQGEIDRIVQEAAAKAKAKADAAKARAKTAREKAHRAYLNTLADEESSLKRRVTTTRKAVLKAAGLARNVATEQKKLFTLPGANEGLLKAGNIDLLHRKVAHLAGGEIATVKSFSIHDKRGEVLLAQVIGGVIVSQKKAIEHYRKTGENLGIFKSVADANRYAERLHVQQDQFYSTLTKPGVSVASLVARVKAAEDPLIALLRRETKDKSLTRAERRRAKGQLEAAIDQEKKDIASVKATFQGARDAYLSLQIANEEFAILSGKGSQARLTRLQTQQENQQKANLRKIIATQSAIAEDASKGVKAQLAARQKANAAEKALLDLQGKGTERQDNLFSLRLARIENEVARAGDNQTKLNAAYAKERKLINGRIKSDRERLKHLAKYSAEWFNVQNDITANQGRLIGLGKKATEGTGFSLSDLYSSASREFASYGSNIGPEGTPLSGGDMRRLLGKEILDRPQIGAYPKKELHALASALIEGMKKGAKKARGPIVVHQTFNDPRDPYAGMRAAQQAAEHFYVGG